MARPLSGVRAPRRIRLLWVIDSLTAGGAERLVASFAQHLDRTGFDLHVCSLAVIDGNAMAAELARRNVPLTVLGARNLRDLLAFARLLRLLRREQIDLIHTHLMYADIWGAIAGVFARRPVLSTLHVIESEPPMNRREALRRRLAGLIMRKLMRKVVAVSEATRSHCLNSMGLRPERVTTAHNGIALEDFTLPATFDRADKRRQLGLAVDAPVIITVAVLRPDKGHRILLDAAPKILQRCPDSQFLFVGSGEAERELQRMVAVKNIADRVIFAGLRHDVPELLAASDLFVLPTLNDAFPTTLLEAMAMRLPVVASQVGGVPEIVTDHVTGLLVAPDDSAALGKSIVTLLGDPSRMAKMGERGRARVETEFSAGAWARRLEQIYESCLEGK